MAPQTGVMSARVTKISFHYFYVPHFWSKLRYMRSQTTDPLVSHQFQTHQQHHLLYHHNHHHHNHHQQQQQQQHHSHHLQQQQQQQQHLLHHHHHLHHLHHQRDPSVDQSEASIYTISSHPQQRQCLLRSFHSASLMDDDIGLQQQQQQLQQSQQQLHQQQQQQQQVKSFSGQTLDTLISPTTAESEEPAVQTLPPCYTRLQHPQTLKRSADQRRNKANQESNEADYGPFGGSCFCVREGSKTPKNGVYIALEDAPSSVAGGGFPARPAVEMAEPCRVPPDTDSSRCSAGKALESSRWEPAYLSKIDLLEVNPQCCNQSNFF